MSLEPHTDGEGAHHQQVATLVEAEVTQVDTQAR